jgi:hypothetical protein
MKESSVLLTTKQEKKRDQIPTKRFPARNDFNLFIVRLFNDAVSTAVGRDKKTTMSDEHVFIERQSWPISKLWSTIMAFMWSD